MALLEDETYFRLARALFACALRPVRALGARFKASYKTPEFWLTFAAYAIPLAFLLYVLYWNFLPFGYNKTFTIDVGAEGDTSGEFYLEPSESLSERKTTEDGTTYRELNGLAYAIFKPKAVLKDAEITVEVEGEGVEIIPPYIDFNPNVVEWDYSWDFTQGKQPEELGLAGDAFPFDGCMYFDGKSKLELPDSADKFEDGPFTVYAEWTPEDSTQDFQQVVGHYNWELLQNKDSVSFRVGRMNDIEGPSYSIFYPVTPEFFRENHTAFAIYSPSTDGSIELFIDHKSAGRVYIGKNKIWKGYGSNSLTFGKSSHGMSGTFHGCVSKIKFLSSELRDKSNIKFHYISEDTNEISAFILSTTSAMIRNINFHVSQ